MTDPLSISTAVIRLIGTCVSTINTLNNLRKQYAYAQIAISTLCVELAIISASLSQLQSLLLQDSSGLESRLKARPDLRSTFDTALTGCAVVLSVVEIEIKNIVPETEDLPELGKKAKARYMWNEETITQLSNSLSRLQVSIILLLQTLQVQSVTEIRDLITANAAVLQQVDGDTKQLRAKTPSITAPKSIYEPSIPPLSYSAQSGYAESEKEFFFDDDVVDSRVYRRTLALARSALMCYPGRSEGSFLATEERTPTPNATDQQQPIAEIEGQDLVNLSTDSLPLENDPPATFMVEEVRVNNDDTEIFVVNVENKGNDQTASLSGWMTESAACEVLESVLNHKAARIIKSAINSVAITTGRVLDLDSVESQITPHHTTATDVQFDAIVHKILEKETSYSHSTIGRSAGDETRPFGSGDEKFPWRPGDRSRSTSTEPYMRMVHKQVLILEYSYQVLKPTPECLRTDLKSILAKSFHANPVAGLCCRCGVSLVGSNIIVLGTFTWHSECFACGFCNTKLAPFDNLKLCSDGNLTCHHCSPSCCICRKLIRGRATFTEQYAFCASCFRCTNCNHFIMGGQCAENSTAILCLLCHEQTLCEAREARLLAQPSNRFIQIQPTLSKITETAEDSKAQDVDTSNLISVHLNVALEHMNAALPHPVLVPTSSRLVDSEDQHKVDMMIPSRVRFGQVIHRKPVLSGRRRGWRIIRQAR